MIYGNQISDYLKRRITQGSVIITSIDRLPTKFSYPLYLVVNESESTKEGSHWVAIFINKEKQSIYFDSYGRQIPERIKQFLMKHKTRIQQNKSQFQAINSTKCGMFCICFLIICSKNCISNILRKMKSKFSETNQQLNELCIDRMIENIE